jgi:hypothetical protein
VCALAIATGSVDFATERVAEPCAIALPCDARLRTLDTSVTVNAAHPVVWSSDNAGH